MPNDRAQQPPPDWPVFVAALSVLVTVCAPLFLFPLDSQSLIDHLYSEITNRLGIFYLWGGFGVLLFCIWIALSRHGAIKLGPADSQPQFSTYSWASMLFCAGVATGILYWGTIEWTYYFESPPFGIEPRSAEAVRWASAFGIFHWGPTGWAFYCLPALAIGHAYYCRGIPRVRVSTACHAVLGKQTNGVLGKLLDICFMMGLLGAAGTSLGFGTPMIAAGIGHIFGLDESYLLTVVIAILCTAIFGTSVYLGLEKGIRRLSNINMAMTLALLAFVLCFGPTAWLIQMGTANLGRIALNTVKMHALTGPFDQDHYQFARDWTIFYWAWWIAVGPFMGLFIAQISRGRTFRQIVVGTLTLGSLGCAIFYMVLGNYALHVQQANVYDIVTVKNESGAPAAIISVIATLPMAEFVVPFFCMISLVFLATTYDSASYALASSASTEIAVSQLPARWHRLFWAFMLALLPTALLVGDSGGGRLRSLQTASLIVSVPLYAIFIVMAISLVKAIRQDEGNDYS